MMLAAGALVLLPGVAPAAESDKSADKARCADAYRSAQIQRKNGALKRARESLLVCVSDRCPSVVQPDCTRWLTEVEAALPSVSFAAKGVDGSDLTSVRVFVDEQLATDTLDGKAIPVDPGSHSLRFEYEDEPPIEQNIVVREGEKARVVSVSWAKTGTDDASASASSESRSRRAPASAWVTGAIGLGGIAAFAVLGAHGMARRSALEKECFGSCAQDQVDSIKAQMTAADVALGVGLVSLGVSAVLFLTSGGASSEPASGKALPRGPAFSFGIAPTREGGAASLGARF